MYIDFILLQCYNKIEVWNNMKIKIREQAGTDAGRKFDYQMAVALDYLLTLFNDDAIILIETLEDFAILHNLGTEKEEIEIFQVKTKNSGLYTKSSLWEDNVLGKIILTDIYFDSKANSLNIICNTNLKGDSTEAFENFRFQDTLTDTELAKLKDNVTTYLKKDSAFNGEVADYIGKLIYIKSALPFSDKQDRYSETLIGKTHNIISQYLGDENHCINPQVIFNTLKLLIDKQRRNRYRNDTIDLEDAIILKGIPTHTVKKIIDRATENQRLSKTEILHHASTIFSPQDFLKIKEEYPQFLSYKANLEDKVFLESKSIVENEYKLLTESLDSLDEIARQVAINCVKKIPCYSLAVIQLLTIIVIYD